MNQKLKIITGLISLGLLIVLVYRLTSLPDGMFLSGLCLGGMIIVLMLIGGLLLAGLIKLLWRKIPFCTTYFILTSLAFIHYHYKIYSPTLKIIVPENYTGEINMIKSNLSDNILTTDTNGIGYLNEWTFNQVYTKPIVIDKNGKDLTERSVGFSRTHFWGIGGVTLPDSIKIKSLSFEIVPKQKLGEKQYYHTDLRNLVDKSKIK